MGVDIAHHDYGAAAGSVVAISPIHEIGAIIGADPLLGADGGEGVGVVSVGHGVEPFNGQTARIVLPDSILFQDHVSLNIDAFGGQFCSDKRVGEQFQTLLGLVCR